MAALSLGPEVARLAHRTQENSLRTRLLVYYKGYSSETARFLTLLIETVDLDFVYIILLAFKITSFKPRDLCPD